MSLQKLPPEVFYEKKTSRRLLLYLSLFHAQYYSSIIALLFHVSQHAWYKQLQTERLVISTETSLLHEETLIPKNKLETIKLHLKWRKLLTHLLKIF